MSDASEQKAERKVSAAEANDTAQFKDTEFGRRRVARMPQWFTSLGRLIAMPLVWYRRWREARLKGTQDVPTR